MNEIKLTGIIKNIEPSHTIDNIQFNKANMIVKRSSTGQEDVVNLRFKSFANPYKENDEISIVGNLRLYSYKTEANKNKVVIYVFTYFDKQSDETVNNVVNIDGRICKINPLRHSSKGKHNLHFILANNLHSADHTKRLNSYIPCIAWGNVAIELSELKVNSKVALSGELHSREHTKVHPDGNVEFRVAHELLVTGYKVIE